MGFRKHLISSIVLVILIAITPVVFLWVWNKSYMIVTLAAIAGVWVAEVFYLIYLQQKNLKEVKTFLQTLKYSDTSIKFNKPKADPTFKGFDRIIEVFQDIKLEKERELNFFKLAAEHSGIGLLAFSRTGEIKLINKAFKELFNIGNTKDINVFSEINQTLFEFLNQSKPGIELLKLIVDNNPRHFAARVVSFKYENEEFKLIALQDIKNEIDQTELDAWQKLIRVLRHEIHNSLSPITFMSSGLVQLIDDELTTSKTIKPESASNIQEGLRIIRKRSIGLSEFVENYKALTNLPLPNIQQISVIKLFNHIESLFHNESIKNGIILSIEPPKNDSTLLIDEKLIEQVLINIIKNAFEATQGIIKPFVKVDFSETETSQIISITDNGKGISQDIIDNIFTPFFTTKKDGTGIGLSLSRQIMRIHNGILTVSSQPNGGTIFFLKF